MQPDIIPAPASMVDHTDTFVAFPVQGLAFSTDKPAEPQLTKKVFNLRETAHITKPDGGAYATTVMLA